MVPNLTPFAVDIPNLLSDNCLSNLADNNVVGQVNEKSVRFIKHMIRNSRRHRLMMQSTVNYLIARRKRLPSVCLIYLLMLMSQGKVITQLPRRRSYRRLVRNTGWWENLWKIYSHVQYKKTFRISRATFRFIFDRIKPITGKTNIHRGPHFTWQKTCHKLIVNALC